MATACNKEKDIKPQAANATASNASKEGGGESDCVFNVTVCNGTFIFANQAEYDVVYNCLEQEYEQHNDDFEAQYANLNDDDFNAMADQTGFDEDATLLAFEQGKSFNSYRQLLRDLEDAWLNNVNLNTATDPDLLDYFDDPVANALMSHNRKVLIGTNLYLIDNTGELWVKANATCNDIPNIGKDPANLAKDPSITPALLSNSSGNPDCISNEKKCDLQQYGNNGYKQFKWKAKFRQGGGVFDLVKPHINSKIVSYKKKANGHWKNYKTTLRLELAGTTCNTSPSAYSQIKEKRRNRLKKGIPLGSWIFLNPYLSHPTGAIHFNYHIVGQYSMNKTY